MENSIRLQKIFCTGLESVTVWRRRTGQSGPKKCSAREALPERSELVRIFIRYGLYTRRRAQCRFSRPRRPMARQGRVHSYANRRRGRRSEKRENRSRGDDAIHGDTTHTVKRERVGRLGAEIRLGIESDVPRIFPLTPMRRAASQNVPHTRPRGNPFKNFILSKI